MIRGENVMSKKQLKVELLNTNSGILYVVLIWLHQIYKRTKIILDI